MTLSRSDDHNIFMDNARFNRSHWLGGFLFICSESCFSNSISNSALKAKNARSHARNANSVFARGDALEQLAHTTLERVAQRELECTGTDHMGGKQTLDKGTLIHAGTSDSFWGRASAGAHAQSFELGLNHRLYIKDGRSHVTSPSVLLFALFWHIEASVFCSFVSRSDQIWMITKPGAPTCQQSQFHNDFVFQHL